MMSFLRTCSMMVASVLLVLVSVGNVKAQPAFTSNPVTGATVGNPYTYAISATDPSNSVLNFSAVTKPAWLALNNNGQSTASQFGGTVSQPAGIAGDIDGNIYVTNNSGTGIYKITPDGTTTLWFTRQTGSVYAMYVYNGNLYVSYYTNSVTGKSGINKISLINPTAEIPVFSSPTYSYDYLSMTYNNGFLYIAAYGEGKVIKLNIASQAVSDVVTVPSPFGVGFNSAGLLYIASYGSGSIYTYNLATSVLSQVITGLHNPSDVKIDVNDNVYVSGYQFVRKYTSDLSSFVTVYTASSYVWGMSITPTGALVFGDYGGSKVAKLQTGASLTGTPASGDIGNNNVTIRVSNGTTTTDQDFTIAVTGPPTISSLGNVNKNFGDAAFSVTDPASNSAGGFGYSSNNTAVATIAGNTVTIVGAGTAIITATQSASGFYTTGSTTFTVTVNKLAPTIASISPITKMLTTGSYSVVDPVSNSTGAFTYTSSNTAVATISGGIVNLIGAGTSTITATQAATTNYTAGTTTYLLTVSTGVGPAGINNGILMWLDASDIDADANSANDPVNNTSLAIWKDKSGLTHNATTFAGQNNITFLTNQINGKPVAHFTRVNDALGSVMEATGVDIRAAANPAITMFTVYKQGTHNNDGGQGQALWGNDNGAWDRFFYNSWSFSDNGIVSLGTVNPTNVAVTGAGIIGKTQLMTAVYNNGIPSGSNIYFNGAVVNTFTDNTDPGAAQPDLRIGWDGDNGTFNGDIAEFIVYNRKLTDCEILQVNQYLGAKYGVTFTSATITPSAPPAICAGETVTLTASTGSSYQWYKDGVAIPSATSVNYDATVSGTYTVAITTGGCTATSSGTVVSVNPLPVVTAVSGNTTICSGNTTTLTAGSTATNPVFKWYTAAAGGTLLYTGASYTTPVLSANTTYYVDVTSIHCTSSTRNSITVTVNQTPSISIAASSSVICPGVTTTLTANSGGGNAVHFNGTSSYVDLGTGVVLPQTFTEEAWIYSGSGNDGQFHGFIGYQVGGSSALRTPSMWIFDGNAIHGGFGDGTNFYYYITGNVILQNTWNHIAQTYDGVSLKVYVNGTQITTLPTNNQPPANTIPYNIGVKNIGRVDNYFKGDMDEVRLWNIARTQAQIQADMNRSIAVSSTGLVAYYKMDEGVGLSIVDANAGATGTLTNAPAWTVSSAPIGGTITWSPATGLNTTVGPIALATPTITTTYIATATDAATGCNAAASTTVTVNPLPVATIAKTDITCTGGSNGTITVTASSGTAPYQYSIDGGTTYQSSNIFSGLAVGNYSVFIKDVSSCPSVIGTVAIGVQLPEINLTGNAVSIVKGDVTPSTADNTDFGTANPSVTITKSYVIQNTGNLPLTVSAINISGANASEFAVSGISLPATIAANSSAGFTLAFNSAIVGNKTATVTVVNNDCNEAAYDFAVEGQIACVAPSFANSNVYLQASTDANGCTATVTYPLSTSGVPAPVVSYVFSGATTGTGMGTGSGQVFNKGVTHVVVSAINTCGSPTVAFDVTVVDDVKPVVITKNTTIYLDATGHATLQASSLDNGSHDNCGTVTFLTNSSGIICGTAAEGSSLTLTAPAGKVISGINFASYGTPNGTCGNFTYGSCNAANSMAIVSGMAIGQNSVTIAASNSVFTDPCGGTVKRLYVEATYTSVGASNVFDCGKLGDNQVTLIVTDADGNSETGTAIVTVADTIKPVVLTKNITLCLDANGSASITAAQINNGSADNCSIASYSLDKTTFNSTNVGVNTVTLRVTDGSGNVGMATATVTINALPVTYTVSGGGAYCAGATGVTVGLNGSETGISYQLLRNAVAVGTAIAGNGSAISFGIQTVAGTYTVAATNTTTGCNSNMGGSAVVVVNPNPVIVIAPSASAVCIGTPVVLNASQVTTQTKTYYIPLSQLINLSGSCDGAGLSYYNSCNGSPVGFSWNDNGMGSVSNVSISFSVGVECSAGVHVTSLNSVNGASVATTNNCDCSVYNGIGQPFTVNFANPVYTVGGNNTFMINAENCFGLYKSAELNNSFAVVTVTYGGSGSAATINNWLWTPGNENTAGITVAPSATTGYSVTGTDANGCTGTANATVTVNPLPVATITAAGQTSVCPGYTVSLQANAGSDYTYQWFKNGVNIAGATSIGYTATGSGNYSVVITNGNGCVSNPSNTIAVAIQDITNPYFSSGGIVTTATNAAGEVIATSAAGAIINYIAPVGADNCSVASTVLIAGPASGSVFPIGSTTVTYQVTDGSGNTATSSFTVIVSGVPPLIVTPSAITMHNSAGLCGTNVSFAATETTAIPASVITYTENGNSVLPGDFFTVGEHTITATATNAVGSSTGVFTITVTDTENPVIADPLTVQLANDPGKCGATVNLLAPSATDNCGIASTVGQRNDALSLSVDYPVGTTTVTWTVTDIHGNSSVVIQTIIVTDTEKPTITAPANWNVVNDAGVCGATIGSIGNPVVSDNCGIASITNDHVSAFYPVGTTIVTWTVTDIHGNVTDTAKQEVTVIDNEKPIITAPAAITVNNDAGICGAVVSIGSALTGDNCGVAAVVNNAPAVFPVGTTTVTWTVTDVHGYHSTATQIITVTDTENPTITAPSDITVNNDAGKCSAAIHIGTPVTDDNCAVATVTNNHASPIYPVGTTMVTWTVTDIHGNSHMTTQTVTVTDNEKPIITVPSPQVFCANADGSNIYGIPAMMVTDNCAVATVNYSITGATTRTGSSNDATGSFNTGTSTITWMVTDIHGNTSSDSITVVVNPLPVASFTGTDADQFCNKVILTGSSTISPAGYSWSSTNAPGSFSTNPQLSLGQANGDGNYYLYVQTGNTGCISVAPAVYNFQKQNLVSSYTILAHDKVKLGSYNTVASGSVGVISQKGEAGFKSYSSVSAPGSFVKARRIDKDGRDIQISTPVYAAATGITLPAMYYHTAITQRLSNMNVKENSTSTLSGNYGNLTLKRGSVTTLTGTVFGSIRVEQGAEVIFMAPVINIENLLVIKGPRNGYSYVRFMQDTKVLVSNSVSIGSQVYVNPDNYKVTFYVGTAPKVKDRWEGRNGGKGNKKDREDEHHGESGLFSVHGGDTRVIANIYLPEGKLKVTGGYAYGDYGRGRGDCDRDDDDDRDFGKGNSYVYMTGLFIADEVEGDGKNVIWNSFSCGAAPVSLTAIKTVTQTASKETAIVTPEDEELKITVMPNPSTTYFTLKIGSKSGSTVNLRVMDAGGRVVDVKSKISPNSTIQIGHNYSTGIYYAELIQGTQRKVVQLIKGRG